MIYPGVQFKSFESNPLGADGDFGQIRSYLAVEPVAVHTEVERRLPQPNQMR
jgi:hypothetical protein